MKNSIISNKIIFLGNQKSGTSAISTLFASAIGESAQIDIPCLWPPTPSSIIRGESSFDQIIVENGSYFKPKVLKEPNLTFLFPLVQGSFENCHFVFIVRDPRDNIRSILNRLKLKGSFNKKTWEDFNLPELESAIIDPTLLGQKYTQYIEVLADRWRMGTDIFMANRDLFHLVRYEDFMQQKSQYIYNLALRLGLEVKNSILDFVDQPFQPAGKSIKNYRWFYGSKNLKRIVDICSQNMVEFNY